MALNVIAMFPGQGSQYLGMGKDLLEQFPFAKQTFEEASDAASLDIKKLCLEGPEEQLALTANTQPCILTVSVAIWRVLNKEIDITPLAFAGHSLGEYSAVVCAGKLDFSRAVYLVRRRGEAMQDAVPAGLGAMAAVLNPDSEKLDELCKSLSTKDASVEIVNYNSPQQLVVAGHKTSVDALCKKLEELGTKYVMLNVSAPFHSRLMSKAREVMTPLLNDSSFTKNENVIIPNLTGVTTSSYGADFLIKQIDSPVLWTQSMQTSEKLSCNLYLEVGPGKVLFGLGRRIIKEKVNFVVTNEIQKALVDLQKIQGAT